MRILTHNEIAGQQHLTRLLKPKFKFFLCMKRHWQYVKKQEYTLQAV